MYIYPRNIKCGVCAKSKRSLVNSRQERRFHGTQGPVPNKKQLIVLEWHLHVTVKAFIRRLSPLLALWEAKMCSHSRNVLILRVTHHKVTRSQARTCKIKQEHFCAEMPSHSQKGKKWNAFGFLHGSVRISDSFVNQVLGRSDFLLVSHLSYVYSLQLLPLSAWWDLHLRLVLHLPLRLSGWLHGQEVWKR